MPITSSGTAYTVSTVPLTTHGNCYWGVADAHAADTAIPTIIYAHGHGGPGDQFATMSAWSILRDWLIDNGWAWIEGEGGGLYNWGGPAAQAAYPAYLDHVGGELDLGKKVLLGRSMGGLVTAYLYTQSGIAADLDGWINNSGVSTLFVDGEDSNGDYYTDTATFWLGRLKTAYGVASYAELETAAAYAAPELWPATEWAGKNILCCYGDADTTVPFTPRGAGPLREIWAGQPTIDLASLRPGGDHSTSNGSYLDTVAMISFLSELAPDNVEPPPPATYVSVISAYLFQGGFRYPYTPRKLESAP